MALGIINPGAGVQMQHPVMRVKVAPPSGDARVDADGNEIAPTWSAEQNDHLLVPLEMQWGSNGTLTTLTVRRELGGQSSGAQGHAEEQAHLHGSRVRLVDDAAGQEWFAGLLAMESMLIQAQPDNEQYTFTAYGPELRLQQKIVRGQWFATPSVDDSILAGGAGATLVRDNVIQTDIPCVFNKGDRGNVFANTGQRWRLSTSDDVAAACAVFESADRRVIVDGTTKLDTGRWTAYLALRSLVEYIDDYDVISPTATDWAGIKSLLGTRQIGEVDVDGKDLLSAIKAVLYPLGFSFAIEPWSDGNWKHRLIVYNPKKPAQKKSPYFAPLNSDIADVANRAELQRLHFVRDNHRARNDVTVLGERAKYQVSLQYCSGSTTELWPVWDTTASAGNVASLANYATDNVIDPFSFTATAAGDMFNYFDPAGEHYGTFPHVWRSFAWNEDGALSEFANSGGTPVIPDAALKIGGQTGSRARIARPIGPTLAYDDDAQAKTHPAKVILSVSTPEGTKSVDITEYCEVWEDRAGFTITRQLCEVGPTISPSVWRPFEAVLKDSDDVDLGSGVMLGDISYLTLLHNTIRGSGTGMTLRLVGTIDDDKCVEGVSHRMAASSWPLLAKKAVRIPTLRKRSEIYEIDDTTADETDDTVQATLLARQIRDAAEDELGHGSLMIPFLTRVYSPGVGIPNTKGRKVHLNTDGGGRLSCPVVHSVAFRFEQTNTTEIRLDSPLIGIAAAEG